MCKNPGKEHLLVTCNEFFYIIPICMETYGMDSAKINMVSIFSHVTFIYTALFTIQMFQSSFTEITGK